MTDNSNPICALEGKDVDLIVSMFLDGRDDVPEATIASLTTDVIEVASNGIVNAGEETARLAELLQSNPYRALNLSSITAADIASYRLHGSAAECSQPSELTVRETTSAGEVVDKSLPKFPKKFRVAEDNKIYDGDKLLGQIKYNTDEFQVEFVDPEGKILITGSFVKLPAPLMPVDFLTLKDSQGNEIATIEEKCPLYVGSVFKIESERYPKSNLSSWGNKDSTRPTAFNKKVEFRPKLGGAVHAVLTKGENGWNVEIKDNEIEPMLLAFIPWIM